MNNPPTALVGFEREMSKLQSADKLEVCRTIKQRHRENLIESQAARYIVSTNEIGGEAR